MQINLLCGGHQHSESHHETVDTLYIYSERNRSASISQLNIKLG